jgi:hypothetical protein
MLGLRNGNNRSISADAGATGIMPLMFSEEPGCSADGDTDIAGTRRGAALDLKPKHISTE